MNNLTGKYARQLLKKIVGLLAYEEEIMANIVISDADAVPLAMHFAKCPEARENFRSALEKTRSILSSTYESVGKILIKDDSGKIIGVVGFVMRGCYDDDESLRGIVSTAMAS